jgi:hypothetical protein
MILYVLEPVELFIGCPLSGVVYFVTIIFFTLLTWVTVAVKIIYYHEDIELSINFLTHFPHV